ncbi:hypothetical protein CTZ27_22560 [Streptomyces griseocarneus]|nr:hypothetical protein CTZ27_22560 [Streptomyces griseocarneus]
MRAWKWRHNPLLRRSDIAEWWTAVATVLLMAVLAPLAGALAATGVEESANRLRQDLHPATAILTKDATVLRTGTAPGEPTERARAPVRWQSSGHTIRTAMVQVSPDAKARASTMVWTDSHGRVGSRPPTRPQAEFRGNTAGAEVAAGVCLLLAGAHRMTVKVALHRYRERAWEREWSEVEPLWTHRAV